MNSSIITAFYDIRHQDSNIERYFKLAEIWAGLDCNLIIFTEAKLYDLMVELRSKFLTKTKIIVEAFEETDFYSDKDKLIENMAKFQIHNLNLAKDTADYILLNNNKFYWLKKAIAANYFNSTHFIWLDFGIFHIKMDHEMCLTHLEKIIYQIPDKIRHMKISDLNTADYKDYFKYIRHNIAGGLFSGHITYLTKYISIFYEVWHQILAENWYQLDESLMTIINHKFPELFDCYYGDYSSIIVNYIMCSNFDPCLEELINKYLNNRNYIECQKILTYLELNFETAPWCYKFLYYAIIANYYYNNKQLRPKILNFIFQELNHNNIKMSTLFYNQFENLIFYQDIRAVLDSIWDQYKSIECQNDDLNKIIKPTNLSGQNVLVITKHFNKFNLGLLINRLRQLKSNNDIEVLFNDWSALSLKNLTIGINK